MNQWESDFLWLHIRHLIQEKMGMDKLPDMNAILLLVGIQELGFIPESMTKEVKQDLMHIGVCALLSSKGYYTKDSIDSEGWPHYRQIKKMDVFGEKNQEMLLIECGIAYFSEMIDLKHSLHT